MNYLKSIMKIEKNIFIPKKEYIFHHPTNDNQKEIDIKILERLKNIEKINTNSSRIRIENINNYLEKDYMNEGHKEI